MNLFRCFIAAAFVYTAVTGQSLRELADRRGIRIGAAVNPANLSEKPYAETLAREFNQLEPENVMKFALIHPALERYNFEPADALVAFARDHKMSVRGHTLVWYQKNPGWLESVTRTRSELARIQQDHITKVVTRYAGGVYAWDVVNEAFKPDGSLRSSIWFDSPGIGQTGLGYIEQAFRWAHAADPRALLFYNDYAAETVNAKSNAIYRMAQDFLSRDVPISGIGMQMHLTTLIPSLAGIESNIKRLTDLGLQVQITELDVRLPVDSSGSATPAALSTQAQIYHDVISLCLKFSRCTAVQTWGFTDKYSWTPHAYPDFGAGLEFDSAYQPKPAYDSMQQAFVSFASAGQHRQKHGARP